MDRAVKDDIKGGTGSTVLIAIGIVNVKLVTEVDTANVVVVVFEKFVINDECVDIDVATGTTMSVVVYFGHGDAVINANVVVVFEKFVVSDKSVDIDVVTGATMSVVVYFDTHVLAVGANVIEGDVLVKDNAVEYGAMGVDVGVLFGIAIVDPGAAGSASVSNVVNCGTVEVDVSVFLILPLYFLRLVRNFLKSLS